MAESRVAIVTGAAGGLGGAMARALLLGGGFRVVAVDVEHGGAGLTALAAEAAARGTAAQLLVLTASVRHPAACAAVVADAVDHFGALHVLVNNAGVGPFRDPDAQTRDFFETPPDYWQMVVETNLNGPFFLARAAAPLLRAAGWGRIVNVTTGLTTMLDLGMTPYGPAKAGLEAASAIWAKELAGTGVTVNVLVPGAMADTGMVPTTIVPDRSTLAPPEVMVAPLLWLVSPAADGVTGKRFVGKRWDPLAGPDRNLSTAMAPVAWEG